LRIFSLPLACFILFLSGFTQAHAQDAAKRKRLGTSSVTIIEPENVRHKPDVTADGRSITFLPAFRVLEEPKSFIKIWKPRLTDKKIAKKFAKESGSKFKRLLTLEVDGRDVPMVITYVSSSYKSGHVYKALFEAENSIVVIATIFDDAPITEEEVLNVFKTIKVNVETPIDDFDDAPFTLDLIPPFDFVFADSGSAFIKSYPEVDELYAKPSMSIGYEDIFIYEGEPAIEDLEAAAKTLFPIDRNNFFQTDEPNYSKMKIISTGYVEAGPGKAYIIEARYKNRACLQYVWDIRGRSEFDDYLFAFAMGDSDKIEPVKADIKTMIRSLKIKP
jgi:hypothetical protein